ncbi:MAG: hypothetical protein HYX60_11995, partial [Legionella longbeachae]|nr:hypothetical protein [Legionella longbeachae]
MKPKKEIDGSRKNQLLQDISKKIYKKVNKFIPYSANHPDLDNWEPHRNLVINLVRAKKDTEGSRDSLGKLNLFIGEEKAKENFGESVIQGKYFNLTNPTVNELIKKLKEFHRKKKYHKPHRDDTYPLTLVNFPINMSIEGSALKKIHENFISKSPLEKSETPHPHAIIIKQGTNYYIYGKNEKFNTFSLNKIENGSQELNLLFKTVNLDPGKFGYIDTSGLGVVIDKNIYHKIYDEKLHFQEQLVSIKDKILNIAKKAI